MSRSGSVFPRLKRRGPIEASLWTLGGPLDSALFPRLKRRGPIEARGATLTFERHLGISTSEKAWPH